MQTDLPKRGDHPATTDGADDARSATGPVLSAVDRRNLRAAAHHLDPVVMIGEAGLTPSVLAETDRALTHHGLIKIRVLGDDREQRVRLMEAICGSLGCAPVQMIGKLLVLWRPIPETPSKPDRSLTKKQAARAIERTGDTRRRSPAAVRPNPNAVAPIRSAPASVPKARTESRQAGGPSAGSYAGATSAARKSAGSQKPVRPAGATPGRARTGSSRGASSSARAGSGVERGGAKTGRSPSANARSGATRGGPSTARAGASPRRDGARPASGGRPPAARKRKSHS